MTNLVENDVDVSCSRPQASAAGKWLNKWAEVFTGGDYMSAPHRRQTLSAQLMSINSMDCFAARERTHDEWVLDPGGKRRNERYESAASLFTSVVMYLENIASGSDRVVMEDIMITLPHERGNNAHHHFSSFYTLFPNNSPERELIQSAWNDFYGLCEGVNVHLAGKSGAAPLLNEVASIRQIVETIGAQMFAAADKLENNPSWAYFTIRNNLNIIAGDLGLHFDEFKSEEVNGDLLLTVKNIDPTSSDEMHGLSALGQAIYMLKNEGVDGDVKVELIPDDEGAIQITIPGCSDRDLVLINANKARTLAASIVQPGQWTAEIADGGMPKSELTQFERGF